MAKTPARQPIDFNQLEVGARHKVITDPDNEAKIASGQAVSTEYPKHLHRFSGIGQAHEYVEVLDAKGEAAAERDGFGTAQEADAEHRAAVEATKAPRAPKSAAKAKAKVEAPAAPKKARTKKVKTSAAGEPATN